jgi:hypothetical protein
MASAPNEGRVMHLLPRSRRGTGLLAGAVVRVSMASFRSSVGRTTQSASNSSTVPIGLGALLVARSALQYSAAFV